MVVKSPTTNSFDEKKYLMYNYLVLFKYEFKYIENKKRVLDLIDLKLVCPYDLSSG
jgi:hypothetical protein